MTEWRQISTPDDFPLVRVSVREGPEFAIEFPNKSFDGWKARALWLFSLVAIAGFFPAAIWSAFKLDDLGFNPLWGLLACFGLLIFSFSRLQYPWRSQGRIELDYGRDELRVLKNGRRKVRRKLSNLHNMTLELHPRADEARLKRMMQGEKSMSTFEKTHALTAWFGVSGAERVDLVYRAEWPPMQSLGEVLRAVRWVETIHEEGTKGGAAASSSANPDTIKPPVD